MIGENWNEKWGPGGEGKKKKKKKNYWICVVQGSVREIEKDVSIGGLLHRFGRIVLNATGRMSVCARRRVSIRALLSLGPFIVHVLPP